MGQQAADGTSTLPISTLNTGGGIRTHTLVPQERILSPLGNHPMSKPVKGLRVSPESVGHLMATDSCQTDPDLAAVVDAWDRLPEAIRAGITAMVKTASK